MCVCQKKQEVERKAVPEVTCFVLGWQVREVPGKLSGMDSSISIVWQTLRLRANGFAVIAGGVLYKSEMWNVEKEEIRPASVGGERR